MQEKRRDLLKALTVGGGAITVASLPTKWSKPVVEGVLLPAHAETTTPIETPVPEFSCTAEWSLTATTSVDRFVSAAFLVYSDSEVVLDEVRSGNSGFSDTGTVVLGSDIYYVRASAERGPAGSSSLYDVRANFNAVCCPSDVGTAVSGISSSGGEFEELFEIDLTGDECTITAVGQLPDPPIN